MAQPHMIVESTLVDRMLTIPELRRILPALGQIQPNKGCNCKAGALNEAYLNVKRQIATLTGEPLEEVKKLLGAKSLQVIYRDGGGQLVNRTL